MASARLEQLKEPGQESRSSTYERAWSSTAGHDTRRLKVLLVTVGMDIGGTEGQLLEIASRLDRRRFDVTVCILKPLGCVGHELMARGIPVTSLHGKGAWDVRVLYRLVREVRRIQPDVVHSFLFFANVAARLACLVEGRSVVVSSYRALPFWTTRSRRLIDQSTAWMVDAMTCCSEAVRREVVRSFEQRHIPIVTIHNGIDVEQWTNQMSAEVRPAVELRPNLPVIGTVCRLKEPGKGLTTLLEAVALLQQNGTPMCQVLIVGDGPAAESLHGLAARLSISKSVVFTGSRRDVPQLMGLLDVFVLPSHYEGFGIAIAEAMAAGKPVVATTVGGIPEIVKHEETGLLVPPAQPAALADAIRRCLERPQWARQLGANGRRRASAEFAISGTVHRHELLYESLVQNKRKP